MSEPAISLTERDGGAFLELRLERPPRNVLDGDALDALTALAAAAASSERYRAARALLVTAAGPNFCVGASVPEHARAHVAAMLGRFHGALRALVESDLPIVAAVRGHCLGGGLELVSLATRVVVHPAAQLGQPEIRLGAMAPIASLVLPRRIGQARAEDLLLSGRTLDAPAALASGLVDAVADDPEAAAADWIRANLVPHSASCLRLATRAARSALRRELAELLPGVERLYVEQLSPTHDAEEGIAAFLEKRAPRWEHR